MDININMSTHPLTPKAYHQIDYHHLIPFPPTFSPSKCKSSLALPYCSTPSLPYSPTPSHWISAALVSNIQLANLDTITHIWYSLHQECLKHHSPGHSHLLHRLRPGPRPWPLPEPLPLVASWRRLGRLDRLLELHRRRPVRGSRPAGLAFPSRTGQQLLTTQSDQS